MFSGLISLEADEYIFVPRAWMKIDELLAEAEKQSNIEIQTTITDTREKMVLYNSLTSLDHILEAVQEYYEFVLRTEVEIVHEPGKVLIRKPIVIEVKKEQVLVAENWTKPDLLPKQDLILGKEFVLPKSKSHVGFSDISIDSDNDKPKAETERKLSLWEKFLAQLSKGRTEVGSEEKQGYVLIKSRALDKHFKMLPSKEDLDQLQNEGWSEQKIDELFKPTRIKEEFLSSAIDGVVHIDAIREELWEDLIVIGEEKQANEILPEFDIPSEDFNLTMSLDQNKEVLPTHPRDDKRHPKWILSLDPEKWLPKLESYRHPEEKPDLVSKRLIKRRERSRSIFETELEAYNKMKAERDAGLSRREKRN
jgi:hypothetical protein